MMNRIAFGCILMVACGVEVAGPGPSKGTRVSVVLEDAPACPAIDPPACVVSVSAGAVATVRWRVCCPIGDEAVSIVQAGSGPHWGDSDSEITACGEAREIDLSVPNAGPVWARIDTLEWPFDMDSEITHCETVGAPVD